MLKSTIQKIEEENKEHEYWIVDPKTAHMLHWLVRVTEPKVILEIGTSVGYSALWMASALKANGEGKLWTIESNDERFEKAKDNITEAELGDWIVQVKGHAPEVLSEDPSIPAHVDLAFFDATKREHQAFFDAVFPRMSTGGMIAVDNVLSHRFGQMEKFIEQTHKNSKLKVVEVPVGDGLLIARVV